MKHSFLPKEDRKTEQHVYCGVPLNVFIGDGDSKQWYTHNMKRNEIPFLLQNITNRSLVFNLGSHQSVIALVLAKFFNRVVCVEENKRHHILAKVNIKNNKASNITLLNKKIDEHLTIDVLAQQYGTPSLVYMDIQGMEKIALNGAEEVIKQKTSFLIEVHLGGFGGLLSDYGHTVEDILQPFENYNLFAASDRDDCVFYPLSYSVIEPYLHSSFYLAAFPKGDNK